MTVEADIWSTMLKNASNSAITSATSPLNERGTVIICGSQKCQTAFIDSITTSSSSNVALSNAFGLGYTYKEYVDSSDDVLRDILSKLDVYTLDTPDESILTIIPNTQSKDSNVLVTVALEWSKVRQWASQLAQWINLIKQVFMDDNRAMLLKHRLQIYGSKNVKTEENEEEIITSTVELPLEDGQYEDPLGVDLVIALVGSQQPEDESSADFATQFVRTVAHKHGASVLAVDPVSSGSSGSSLSLVSERLQLPVFSSSRYERTPAQASEIDYTKLVIPAGWDSRAKIEAVKEGFPIDKVLQMWNVDEDDVVKLYKQHVSASELDSEDEADDEEPKKQVQKTDYQEFLAKQQEVLETKLAEEAASINASPVKPQSTGNYLNQQSSDYNVGGIQVENVEEVLRRLKAREAQVAAQNQNSPQTPTKQSRETSMSPSPSANAQQNDMLQSFFQNLLDRRRNSPGR